MELIVRRFIACSWDDAHLQFSLQYIPSLLIRSMLFPAYVFSHMIETRSFCFNYLIIFVNFTRQ